MSVLYEIRYISIDWITTRTVFLSRDIVQINFIYPQYFGALCMHNLSFYEAKNFITVKRVQILSNLGIVFLIVSQGKGLFSQIVGGYSTHI